MSTLWDEIIEPPLHSIDTTFPATRCAKETGWLSDAGPRGLRECELWALLGPNPLCARSHAHISLSLMYSGAAKGEGD